MHFLFGLVLQKLNNIKATFQQKQQNTQWDHNIPILNKLDHIPVYEPERNTWGAL